MSGFNLNNRQFSPIRNSAGGRVKLDAVFKYQQEGKAFTATYSGGGFSDGHLIGRFTSGDKADLVYHCREDANGDLEVGEAKAEFTRNEAGKIIITMDWHWLNLSQASGTSQYEEN